ncbi:MAG: hypothetical protein AB1545_04905 [Thermodesulfobacteriota bacterium]
MKRLLNGLTIGVLLTVLLAALAGCMTLAGGNPLGLGDSWREEVLLHDGCKIIVKRSVDRGGRHEIGQQPPIKEQSLSFTIPATKENVTWKSEYSEDVGLADFMPLLLDIVQGTAYVVSTPVGCLSYNKWGRPNPPYVVFRYANKAWQNIALQELPAEIKKLNLIISSPDNKVNQLGKRLVSAEEIRKINSRLTQPEFKTILREPVRILKSRECAEMIPDGNRGWIGIGWFKKQPSYDACLDVCKKNKMSSQYCPCDRLFDKTTKEK